MIQASKSLRACSSGDSCHGLILARHQADAKLNKKSALDNLDLGFREKILYVRF